MQNEIPAIEKVRVLWQALLQGGCGCRLTELNLDERAAFYAERAEALFPERLDRRIENERSIRRRGEPAPLMELIDDLLSSPARVS